MDHFQSIPHELRAEPFVKWAGGKKKMLSAYDSLFPSHFETYHEPFLGGGSVFLYLMHIQRIGRALLSDANAELIHLYRMVRDDVERVVEEVMTYPYDKEFYYAVRALDPQTLTPVRRAARMLYLNRTCFNGLYRVNRKGQFNVPIGRYDSPTICNDTNLRNVSRLLQGIELQSWEYQTVLDVARPGDFVYLDPPYHAVSAGGRSTSSGQNAFSDAQQGQLYQVFRILDRRGCLVMMSNSGTPLVKQLYRGYDVKELHGARPARGARRGRNTDLVVRNYA